MDDKSKRIERDRQVIAKHGGPAKFARLLELDEPGGTQRVSNWLRRGIPPSIKLEHLDLFMPDAADSQAKEGS
ncbi:hypothetical protein SB394_11875 [Burkholderia sp. BCCIQ04A]|uniref:DNA-binding protein n=1 Tax=Burkholderia anthinoferrum TaxID=3090833 RepID=A0ABU5WNU0_9BURK|nr:hypothetical protein [Burkholderia anthinoferrum]MEB2504610.1 hypothetical protein [Burkholderia anthinoferrum]MEB2530279.1 hypothetical protein [Burkholderia anthinoferrum]MEB2561652.1 hypothetical protein [Burkholderia anthinoferrum]MEB2580598.1 hypothetical protein [Burkholderia anthinoferrum]MEB2634424.1 hypothetical protein [Burkholderia anthinoferrum]